MREIYDSIFMVPKELARFFWDVAPEKLEKSRHWVFIIERLLERGDPKAMVWLIDNFPKKDIVQVLKSSRSLSARSGKFWALFFGVDDKDLACTKKSWPPQRPSASTS